MKTNLIHISPEIITQARAIDQRLRFGGQRVCKNWYTIKYKNRGNHQYAIALTAFENLN